MDASGLLLAVPIFFVLYQGVGLALQRRRPARQMGWKIDTGSSFRRTIREFLERGGCLSVNQFLLQNKTFKTKLDNLLLYSGNPWAWRAETLLVTKEALIVVFLLCAWSSQQKNPILWFIAVGLGYILPDFYLSAKATTRRMEIQKMLPGYIDLLTLTMEGGMDLLAATEKIIEKMRPNALRDEFYALVQENRLGTSRKEAFQHLAQRVNLSDVHSLTAMIIQSEEMGSKLSSVLRSYSEDMRNKRIMRAEEAAGQAPVKMLFPMMVFFFPIVFIIILGPLALNFFASGGLK